MHLRRLCIFVLVLATFAWGSPAEARKWTSRDGKFSVEAELADFKEGNVLLRRADDKIISVPLEKLSLADALYIQKALEALGRDLKQELKSKPAMPLPPVDPPKPNPPEKVAPASSEPKPLDWEPGGPSLTTDDVGWHVQPDPSPDPLVLPADHQIDLRIQRGSAKPVLLYPHALTRFVMIGEDEDRGPKKVYDLTTSSVVGQIEEKATADKMALSPNGKHLATYAFHQSGKIQIWSFATGKPVTTIVLEKNSGVPAFLSFAGNHHVVVHANYGKQISVWEIGAGKKTADLRSDGEDGEVPIAVSPGGHYVAIGKKKLLDIVDTRNGQSGGDIRLDDELKNERITAVAFSHDGSELAVLIGDRKLRCWSTKDGSDLVNHKLKELPRAPGTYLGPKLEWLADNSGWLLHGASVVDRKAGGPVWADNKRRGSYLPHVRFVDATRMLIAEGTDVQQLKLVAIPRESFQAGANVVVAGGVAEDATLPPITATDLAKAPDLKISATAAWTYTPKSVAFPEGIDWQKPFALKKSLYREMVAARNDAGRIVFSSEDDDVKKRNGVESYQGNLFEVYDLASRSVISRFELSYPMSLQGLSPAGDRGAFSTGKNSERLNLYDLTTSKYILGFRPYNTYPNGQPLLRGVHWVSWCSDELLITLSQGKVLAAWKLPACEPLYKLQLQEGGAVTIDAARKTLAVPHAGRVLLLDAATGKTQGLLATPTERYPGSFINQIAFRDDGKALAAVYFTLQGETVVEWELAKGAVKTQIPIRLQSYGLTWVGPRHVLLHRTATQMDENHRMKEIDPKRSDQCTLVDLDRQAVIWTYQHTIGHPMKSSPGDKHWCTTTFDYLRPASMVALSLPDPLAAAAIAKVTAEPPLVDRGTALAIKINIEGNFPVSTDEKENHATQLSNELKKHLTTSLERFKVKIADRADATMHISMRELSASKGLELRSRYGLRTGQTLHLTLLGIEVQASIRDAKGEEVWKAIDGFGINEVKDLDLTKCPTTMTPENYIRQEEWKTAVQWVHKLQIPLPLYRGSAFNGLGESLISPTGARSLRLPKIAE